MSYFRLQKYPFSIDIQLKEKYTVFYDRLGYDTVKFLKIISEASVETLSDWSDLKVLYVTDLCNFCPSDGYLYIARPSISREIMDMVGYHQSFVLVVSRCLFIAYEKDISTFEFAQHRNYTSVIERR